MALCLLAVAVACGGGSDDDDEPVVPCTSNADCIPENPCTIGRCGLDNICAFQSGPDGAAANEKEGDCRRATCRNGQPTYIDDDSDVLDDDEPCTDDTCENGMPVNSISDDGDSCEFGSGSGVCQQGACIVLCTEGNAASQCDDDDICTDDVCVPCENDNCFGQGQCAHEPGNGPGPDDGQDCTTDLCEDGEPVHEPAPAGTACTSGGNVCNAAGDCVGCANDDDCAGFEVRNCYVAVCNSGECEEEVAPKGTIPEAADTVGDCKRPICSGTGSMTTEDDNEDVPDDMNPCTVETCVDGSPMYESAAPGAACDGTGVCSDYAECCVPFVYDDPSDVVALRRNYTDYFSYTSFLATFNTASGATVDLASLGVNPEQVMHDPLSGQVYYLTYYGLGMFADCGDATLEGITLPVPDTATSLSSASALAWDSNTEQVLLASQGSSGVLYSYDTAASDWTELGNLNFYPIAASYFSATDKLYLADSSWATSVSRFTPAGVLEDAVSLAPTLTNTWYTTHLQMREVGNYIYYILQGYDLSLGHMYSFVRVDPATGVTSVIY